ncbi:MAG: AEC family transporter [Clostridia bacterium]|nr:AEC family transporter [Clostridia bacterium]
MLQTFFNSISAVLVVMLIMAVGYFMGRKGWLKAEHKPLMYKLIIWIAMPAMCINSIQTNFTREMFQGAGPLMAVPLLNIGLLTVLAVFLTRFLNLPRKRVGVFITMCCLSNSVFIGYPMCLELFGENCVPYVMWYYVFNTTFFQTVGVWLIRRSAVEDSGFSLNGLKAVLKNPPFIGIMVGMLLLALDIRLPHFAMSFTKYLSNMVSPLGLIYTGFIMYETGLGNLKFERGLPTTMAVRFIVSPLLCIALCVIFGISGIARDTYIIEVTMPTMTQVTVQASGLGADEQYAAKGAAISTIGMFVVIPVLMMLL